MQHGALQRLRYRLADHVRACRIDNQVILLDLRRSKYLGLSGPQLSALAEHILDWPTCSTADDGDAVGRPSQPSSLEAWIGTLRQQKMLAEATGTSRHDPSLEEPQLTLHIEAMQRQQASLRRDLPDFAAAAIVAKFWLRYRDLAGIAESVKRLRRGGPLAGAPVELDELSTSVSSYVRMRPFLMTAQDQCLRDSLTLVRFLARRGLYPTWVIGVKTRPFVAHSWVQSGRVVLNDSHDHVRAYRPILVV